MSLANRLIIEHFPMLFGAPYCMVVGMEDYYKFEDNKRGERLGTQYYVVNNSTASIDKIKVPDTVSAISKEEIDVANKAYTPILAEFSGFTAAIYTNKESANIKYSCKAEGIRIIDREMIFDE